MRVRVELLDGVGQVGQEIEATLNPTGADPDEDAPYYLRPEDRAKIGREVARFVTSMAEDGMECSVGVTIEEEEDE